VVLPAPTKDDEKNVITYPAMDLLAVTKVLRLPGLWRLEIGVKTMELSFGKDIRSLFHMDCT
jgi:hypothetical protein